MRKNLSIKHFAKICDSLSKIAGVDYSMMYRLSKSYNKNYKTKSKGKSIIKIDYSILGFSMICSYTFEDDNYVVSKTDPKYITIRYYYLYHIDCSSAKKGKHLLFRKRYFLG